MKKKRIAGIMLATLIAVSLLPMITLKAAATEYLTYYSTVDFGSSTLTTQGKKNGSDNSSVVSYSASGLILTPGDNAGGGTGYAGSAFFNKKIKQSDGFSTYFNFTLASSSTEGADGIVFIISKNTNGLGILGEGIGYKGITNSVGIEFDTYPNTNDVSDSHIGIDLNGVLSSDKNQTGYSSNVKDLGANYFDSGDTYYVWIDYNGTTLNIYISTASTRPATSSLSKDINLSTYCGDEYYVGFTAATGGEYEQHKINKWFFKNAYVTDGLKDTGTYSTDTTAPTTPTLLASETTVTVSGSTDTGGSGVDHYEYQLDSTTGTWSTYNDTNKIDISGKTSVTIYARAVDAVGNISSISSQTYSKPTVGTVSYSNTSYTGADLSSAGFADGSGLTTAAQGFVYNKTGTPTTSDNTVSGTVSSGTLSASATGLAPGTKYYWRAYATNALGTVYSSSEACFTTPIAAPTVTLSNLTTSGLELSWGAVDGATGYVVRIDGSDNALGSGTISYTVTGLSPNTSHTYSVSTQGEDASTLHNSTTVYTLAVTPAITTAVTKQDGSVVLTINENSNSNSTNYYVEASTTSSFNAGTTVAALGWTNPASTTLTIAAGTLARGTLYYLHVKAENGASTPVETSYSTAASAETVPAVPVVSGISATETSGTGAKKLVVSWSAVTGADSYDVYQYSGGTYTYLGNSSSTSYTDARSLSASGGLVPNTQYTYAVASRNAGTNGTYTDDGCSFYSTTASKYTLATTPSFSSASAKQNGTVVLKVELGDNSSATTYQIQKSTSSDFSSGVTTLSGYDYVTLTAATNTITIAKDTDGTEDNAHVLSATTYYFRVSAKNTENTVTALYTTAGILTVPEIPPEPTLTATETSRYGAKQIVLDWADVTGATSYDVYLYSGGTYTYLGTSATSGYTDARSLSASGGLLPNTQYTYAVASRNAGTSGADDDGRSVYSATRGLYTRAGTPDIDTVTADANGNVVVKIDEFYNPSATRYQVQYSTTSDFSSSSLWAWTDPGADHLITITGLNRGTVYYFRVKGENNESTPVETVYGDITGNVTTIPDNVSGVTVTATGTTTLSLSWSASTGASSYDVYYSEDGSSYTYLKNVTGTSTSDNGLAPNTGRYYKIIARSSSGISTGSAVSASMVYTYAVTPSISLTPQADGTVRATITSTNASGTTYYIEYGTASSLTTVTGNSGNFTGTTWTSGVLSFNTSYYFHVKAINGNTISTTYSTIVSTVTVPATPANVIATPSVDGTTHSITVSWDTLGTTYNVYRDGTLVATTSSTSYKDSGLMANKTYSYMVAAVNSGGTGTASAFVMARTLAEFPGEITASNKTSTSFTITLTPSANLAVAEQYQVTLKSGSTVVTALSWSSDLIYNFSGLHDDTQYDVYVNVRNSDGVARGSMNMLTLYCNRPVGGAIVNDTTDIIKNENSSAFTIQIRLWDPDADTLTVSATIGGILRTVTLTAPTADPGAGYNAELVWDAHTLVEGVYAADIPVTITDGNDSMITLNYSHDLNVDKTAPVITVTGTTVYLNVGDTYTDGGATVTGDDGNGVSTDFSAVDTTTAGTYTVTYTSTDDAGNTTTATRTVIVAVAVSSSNVILTIPSSGIGATSAVLNGEVSTLGALQAFTDHGFVWSTVAIADDGNGTSVTTISLGAKSDLDTFTATLDNLTEETEYFVRPYVVYNGTAIYGAELSFESLAAASDTNRVYISPTTVSRTEDTTSVTFKVSRLASDITAAITIPIAFTGSTATLTNDYTILGLTSDEITIAAGHIYATYTVSIVDDSTDYIDETVVMKLGTVTGYNVVAGNDIATLTIANDDTYVKSSNATISDFELAGVIGTINNTIGTITLTVPYGTDLTDIKPDTFTIDANATVTPTADTLRDFSVGTVAYTVTAEDGTTKRYDVTVTVAAASSDDTLSAITVKNGHGNIVLLTPSFDPSTTDYSASVPSDTDSLNMSGYTANILSAVTITCNGTLCSDFTNIPLIVGTNTVVVTVTAQNGDTTTYYFYVTRAAAGTDANADLISITLSNGILDPGFDKDTTDYNVNVVNSITSTALTVALSNSNAGFTITANGFATTNGADVSLNVGANVFVVKVTATNGTTIKTYSISVSRAAPASGGGGSSSTSSLVPVIVDGETIKAGTQTTSTTSTGRASTTVTVDTALVETQLQTSGAGAMVIVPIAGNEPVKFGVLTGEMVKEMEDGGATLNVDTGDIQYLLPADEIDVNKIADRFGNDVDLSEITITVEIDSLTGTDAKFVADTASVSGYTLVLQPVEFTITAEYKGKAVEIDTFNNYVQRMIAVPDYIDSGKITTAVVVTSSGTYHVPTEVKMINGKYYAVINSLTNSTYALIYNAINFSDTIGHWAENSINNMGSRTVVTGVGNNKYEPDRNITRAEFAVIVVRSLGLNTGLGSSNFTDVATSDWYYGYVRTAVGYGIINGYDDGTFRPKDTITREQAMTMIARAMTITDLAPTLSDAQVDSLLNKYSDASAISNYAKASIAACTETGVVLGRPDSTVASKESITRAEVAVIIERMLKKSSLI